MAKVTFERRRSLFTACFDPQLNKRLITKCFVGTNVYMYIYIYIRNLQSISDFLHLNYRSIDYDVSCY